MLIEWLKRKKLGWRVLPDSCLNQEPVLFLEEKKTK